MNEYICPKSEEIYEKINFTSQAIPPVGRSQTGASAVYSFAGRVGIFDDLMPKCCWLQCAPAAWFLIGLSPPFPLV
jgi:hypothetical protein